MGGVGPEKQMTGEQALLGKVHVHLFKEKTPPATETTGVHGPDTPVSAEKGLGGKVLPSGWAWDEAGRCPSRERPHEWSPHRWMRGMPPRQGTCPGSGFQRVPFTFLTFEVSKALQSKALLGKRRAF